MNETPPGHHEEKKHRLPILLYSLPGAYFITCSTYYHQMLFGSVSNGQVILSNIGEVVDFCWKRIPDHFAFTRLDVFVVMPNHFHGILWIEPTPHSTTKTESQELISLPTIINSWKSAVTKLARRDGFSTTHKLWQPSYWDHVIRTEEGLDKIREYIQHNPMAWELDKENLAHKQVNPFYAWIEEQKSAPHAGRLRK